MLKKKKISHYSSFPAESSVRERYKAGQKRESRRLVTVMEGKMPHTSGPVLENMVSYSSRGFCGGGKMDSC